MHHEIEELTDNIQKQFDTLEKLIVQAWSDGPEQGEILVILKAYKIMNLVHEIEDYFECCTLEKNEEGEFITSEEADVAPTIFTKWIKKKLEKHIRADHGNETTTHENNTHYIECATQRKYELDHAIIPDLDDFINGLLSTPQGYPLPPHQI